MFCCQSHFIQWFKLTIDFQVVLANDKRQLWSEEEEQRLKDLVETRGRYWNQFASEGIFGERSRTAIKSKWEKMANMSSSSKKCLREENQYFHSEEVEGIQNLVGLTRS